MTKKVFLLGAGHRGKSLLKLLIRRNSTFEIAGIYDSNLDAIKAARKDFPDVQLITDDINIIDELNIDLFMICSMNYLHLEQCQQVIKTGTKQIFCEKPLCINREQLNTLHKLIMDNDVNFMTGFVLRHSPFYQKIKDLVQHQIGRITTIDVHDHLYHGHGAHIMTNWRRFKEYSGGHLVEKCVHVLDLINWFLGSDVSPVDVVTMGNRDIWIEENKELGEELKSGYGDLGLFKKFAGYEDVDPFESKKTVLHSSSSLIRYSNQTICSFNMNTFCPNSSRRFHIIGTLGEIEARWLKGNGRIEYVRRGIGKKDTNEIPEERIIYDFGPTNCHGNADHKIVDYLADSVIKDLRNETDFSEAYKATLTGIVLEESFENKVPMKY